MLLARSAVYGRWRWLLALLAMLAGCSAGTVRVSEQAVRQDVRHFVIEARFSIRAERGADPVAGAQGVSGRLLWRHEQNSDQLVFSNPLGQGLAELQRTQTEAVLRLASGEERKARHPGTLVEEFLNIPLPMERFASWMLGKANGRILRDEYGRPWQGEEEGWEIDYRYDDEARDALPVRLIVRHGDGFELRLKIEEWQIIP